MELDEPVGDSHVGAASATARATEKTNGKHQSHALQKILSHQITNSLRNKEKRIGYSILITTI